METEYWVVFVEATGALVDVVTEEPDISSLDEGHSMSHFDGPVPSPVTSVWDKDSRYWAQKDLDQCITVLAFRNRFTLEEKLAIYDARDTKKEGQGHFVQLFLEELNAASFVDLNRIDTVSGVNTLEGFGLIAEGRAAQILTAPIAEHERTEHSI